jgi:competence protein ComEC
MRAAERADVDPGLLAGEPPDLRLLVPAACAWLAAGVAGHLSTAGCRTAVVVLVLVGGAALSTLRRPASLVSCAASWCAAGAILAASLSAAAAVRGPLPALAAQHKTVTLEIVVTGDPHVSAASAGKSRRIAVFAARAVLVVTDQGSMRIRSPIVVLASGYAWTALQPSQRLRATGRLVAASPGEHEAAVFEARDGPDNVTDPSRVQRIAGRIRAGLRDAAAPLAPEPRGLLPGLVDGDTSGLSPDLQASFRATGLTHIVAVSGANVAILLGAVLIGARWVGLRLRSQAVVGVLTIVAFVVVARPEASVLRAAAMGLVAVVALATGRPARALPSLCAAVLVLILIDPALATSVGFALSVLATGGLVVMAPVIRDRLMRWLPRWLAEAVSVPTAATLMCAPVIVMISGRVSLSSIPANLLAEPAVAPATVLGVLAACVALVSLPVAQFFARLGGLPCSWLIVVARTFSRLPGSSLAWPAGGGGALLLGLLVVVLLAAGAGLSRLISER